MIVMNKFIKSERGVSLLELLTAMPILSILMISLTVLLGFGIKSYLFVLSDWEMQREVEFTMESIQHDLMYAKSADIVSGQLIITNQSAKSIIPETTTYELTSGSNLHITRNAQPMTGDTKLSNINILKFMLRRHSEKTIFYNIEAENALTGHRYELRSATTYP
ncbi:MAG: Tfp pilus assembly protein FimT/FimU [Selenomonadaceae bacterium]